MARRVEGVVTIVQESRFQLTDDAGVAHLFILGHGAAAEPAQLHALVQRQARIRVEYKEPHNVVGNVATAVFVLA